MSNSTAIDIHLAWFPDGELVARRRQGLQIEPLLSLTRRNEPDAPTGRIPPRDSLIALSKLTLHIVDWPGSEPAILAIHG